jgi:hypothetical protein
MTRPSATELERRTMALRWFTFHRALGGHANDGDTLDADVRYAGEGELLAIFERLGRPLEPSPEGAPVVALGRSYSGEEYAALRHPIPAHPRWEEPRTTVLFGVRVCVSVTRESIQIVVPTRTWSLASEDLDDAEALEAAFARVGVTPEPRAG